VRRLLFTIRYDGTAYHGWQVQNNALTVQQLVQDALERVLGERVPVTGCSRTDTGVHAEMFCFHTDVGSDIDCERLVSAINAHLPDDIAAYDCREVAGDFHARYSCSGKRYIYRFYDGRQRNPFLMRYTARVNGRLDEARMNEAAAHFVGRHDFIGFCSAGSSVEDTVRTVSEAKVERQGDVVIFTVAADGFLYNMVRIMAGTLLEVSSGKTQPADMPQIIASRERERAGATAKAQGLTLAEVFYGG
jgi:tRNA pseudouridine38-40 synthase